MIAEISGVWPDGTIPPVTPATCPNVLLYVGTDAAIDLTVRTGAGTPHNISGHAVTLFTGWGGTYSGTVLGASSGTCRFTFAQADTSSVGAGRYAAQFEAISPTGIREMLTPIGAIQVLPTVG